MNRPLQFGKAYNIMVFRFQNEAEARQPEAILADAARDYSLDYKTNACWFKRGHSYIFAVDDCPRAEAAANGKLVMAPPTMPVKLTDLHPANWRQLGRILRRQFIPYELGEPTGQDASRYEIADYRHRLRAGMPPIPGEENTVGLGRLAFPEHNTLYQSLMRPVEEEIAQKAVRAELYIAKGRQYSLKLLG